MTSLSVPSAVLEALASVSAEHGFKKPNYNIEEGSKAGDGYSSILYRVTITDDDTKGNAEKHVVMCKTTVAEGVGKTLLQYFKSEAIFYNQILPLLKDVACLEEPLPWPRCHYAKCTTSARPCLIFEDLRLEGFVTASRLVVPDVQHFRLALSQLAKFHGAGMVLLHLKPSVFKEMTKELGLDFSDPEDMKKMEQFSSVIKSSLAMIEDRFPPGSEVHNKIVQLYGGMQAFFVAMTNVPEAGPGIGLVHGDCHINNYMFKYDKGSKAVQAARLIDFQLSRVGGTAMDLASLLLPCTDKPLRDAHLNDLLRGYHSELQDILRAAGINPDSVYSWDQFMSCMREAAKFALCFSPIYLHAMQADEKAALEMRDAINNFHKSDGDVEPGAPELMNLTLSSSIKQRFEDIILTAVELGWL